jgi:hypothetical protein
VRAISRLGGRDQTRLLEMVLAENRRQVAETLARQQAAEAAFRELERRQKQADAVPETKRAAR